MSESTRDAAVNVLAPLVGKAMATVYVADAARRLGKSIDELGLNDVDAMCESLRLKISPFAARPVLDQAMADIKARAWA